MTVLCIVQEELMGSMWQMPVHVSGRTSSVAQGNSTVARGLQVGSLLMLSVPQGC